MFLLSSIPQIFCLRQYTLLLVTFVCSFGAIPCTFLTNASSLFFHLSFPIPPPHLTIYLWECVKSEPIRGPYCFK